MEEFPGLVLIQTDGGRTTIRLDGNGSKVTVGVNGPDPISGSTVPNTDPLAIFTDRVSIDGATSTITVNGTNGSPLLTLDGAHDNGQFIVHDGQGREVLNFTSANAQLLVGAADHGCDLLVRDELGNNVLDFNSATAELFVGAAGAESTAGHPGNLIVRDEGGRRVLIFSGESSRLTIGAVGKEGHVIVNDFNGNETIHLDGSSGDIILANADAAEEFEVAAAAEAAPGAVMVLAGNGTVQPCTTAYDRKVIGVVAGAGDYRPAIVLDRRPGSNVRRVPISVMGKVACRADAAYGAIEVGDLLTSSPTAGTAMRVSDAPQAFGAVIGKALTPLREGTGLVEMVIGLR